MISLAKVSSPSRSWTSQGAQRRPITTLPPLQQQLSFSRRFPSFRTSPVRVNGAMAAAANLDVPNDDKAASPQYKVCIANPSGEKLVGVFDDTGSHDVIVLCHGFRSSKESSTLNNLVVTFMEAGLSTFRFDFSGNGESEGNFHYGNYWKEVEDLRSVLLYLRGQGRKVKAIVGHSKGGNVVLLYASKYKDVDIVLNLSGRFDLERGVKERLGESYMEMIENQGFLEVKDKHGNVLYRVTKESLEDRLKTDMKSAVLSIPEHCRVLTVHGSQDEVVSVNEAKEFDNLISNHTLRILDGANHGYTQHRKMLDSIVADFVGGTYETDNKAL